MSFPPELESARVDRSVELESPRFIAPTKLERWERVERVVLLSFAALLIVGPIVRLSLGHGDFIQLLFLPFGVWCIWQALYEDRLDDQTSTTFLERLLAFAWLWTRRLVVGGVGMLFLIMGFLVWRSSPQETILATVALLSLGVFALWVAFYGAGRSRSMSDDRAIHARRVARYKWWS
jgi:hypothetical protein